MITNDSVVVVASRQISSDLAGASVILNLDSSIYYGLEAGSARVWNLLQQPHTMTEILDVLLAEYDVEPERARRDLCALLEKLLDTGLIEIKNANH